MLTMTEEWVSFWYQCLSQNIDYSTYCTARSEGDTAKCAEYEARFDRIADIYQDFGELDGWGDTTIQSSGWKEWFEPRRHLFIASATVITDPSGYKSRAGHLRLTFPCKRIPELQRNWSAPCSPTISVEMRLSPRQRQNTHCILGTDDWPMATRKSGRPVSPLREATVMTP